MPDIRMTFDGDISISSNKDIELISSSAENDIQNVYIRLMTEPGDFKIYPQLGVSLSELYRNATGSCDGRAG